LAACASSQTTPTLPIFKNQALAGTLNAEQTNFREFLFFEFLFFGMIYLFGNLVG
jgi:hypothetical protein